MDENWYIITGAIDAKLINDFLAWVGNQVQQQKIKRLKLYLSSQGGDMDSAIRAYSFLKGLPIEVTTIGFGQVDSAAVTIFLGGKKRQALDGCRFFLHEGTFTIGNPTATMSAHKETMMILTNLLDRNIDILVREIRKAKSRDEVVRLLQEGKIFTAAEAKEFGLVDEIIDKLPFVAA